MKRAAFLSLAVLAAGWALTLWVMPWSDERVNDLFVYRTFAEPMLSGALPYREIAFEYPPLAAPVIALPGVLGLDEEAFRWAFAIWTLAAAGAMVLLCGALARAAPGACRADGEPPASLALPAAGESAARRAMVAAALAPLLCGALLRTHFDLFPVVILLVGLLLIARDRPRVGLAVLGVGAVTKVFPLLAVPVALAWLLVRGQGREAWQGALACAAVIAAVAGAAIAISPEGAFDAVRYHVDRPVQIESSPAMVLLGLDAVGAGEAKSIASHRSDGLLHPAAAAVTSLFLTALVAFVALLCALVAGARRRAPARARGVGAETAGPRELVIASLAACTAFALFGKVLSPQFVIWVLPLGALAFAWRMHALAAAVALAAVLTQVEFPAHYFDVVAREPAAIALVAARNLALVAVLALSVRELVRARGASEAAGRELVAGRGQQQLLDARRAAVRVGLD
jgi:glycosyl transferase family 87